jgi:NAD(P)-dependent dehydrogenase (short-subunit alcohol dehydrogenase family)
MEKCFDGKVALVTGGSSGIGRAAALAFAKAGARVAVSARRIDHCEETSDCIEQAGGGAIAIQADVSRASDVENLIARCVDALGRLDYAFNNAGIEGSHYVKTADYDEKMWDQVITTNLKGVWLCMKYEIPRMLAQGKGVIVNTSSVAGLTGTTIGCAYDASKHGVVGLTRAAAIEYANQGIRVNAVCPAVIRTPMADRLFYWSDELAEKVIAALPMGRVGTPEEVAEAVIWLCSDSASFVTGCALPVDGGALA